MIVLDQWWDWFEDMRWEMKWSQLKSKQKQIHLHSLHWLNRKWLIWQWLEFHESLLWVNPISIHQEESEKKDTISEQYWWMKEFLWIQIVQWERGMKWMSIGYWQEEVKNNQHQWLVQEHHQYTVDKNNQKDKDQMKSVIPYGTIIPYGNSYYL